MTIEMNVPQIKELIRRELPTLLREDPEMRQYISDLLRDQFADKQETESRFDKMLAELRRQREEDSQRWAEQAEKWKEQDRRWDEHREWVKEQDRRWNEQARRWEENQESIRALDRRIDSTIGALGARWGIQTEESFRNALKSILEESFAVEVHHVNEFDDEGYVFGRPDQVELDLIIKNGLLIIAEIKSSMSRADMYTFGRKVEFYEQRHQRQATRKLVISPMIRADARRVAETLGLEVFSHALDVEEL